MPQTILVIEDDTMIQDLIERALSSEGYVIIGFPSGEEALVATTQATPDLVILDIGLPGIDGYETGKRLKALQSLRDVPLVFLSGRSRAEDNGRSFASGGDLFLRKPFALDQLRGIVGAALSSHRPFLRPTAKAS